MCNQVVAISRIYFFNLWRNLYEHQVVQRIVLCNLPTHSIIYERRGKIYACVTFLKRTFACFSSSCYAFMRSKQTDFTRRYIAHSHVVQKYLSSFFGARRSLRNERQQNENTCRRKSDMIVCKRHKLRTTEKRIPTVILNINYFISVFLNWHRRRRKCRRKKS